MKKLSKILYVIVAIFITMPAICLLSACEPNGKKVASYNELLSALDSNAKVIVLTQDIDVEETIIVNREVTLNLNGKKLYNTKEVWNTSEDISNWSIISVRKNGDLTVKGNGEILALKDDCYAFDVRDGSQLTIENGKFVGNIHSVYVFAGKANINGGEYSIQQTYSVAGKEYEFVMNLYDANRENGTAKMNIKGGTFYKFNPANCKAEGDGTNFVAEGYKSQLVEGQTDVYEVVADNK